MKRRKPIWLTLAVVCGSAAIVSTSHATGGTVHEPQTATSYYSQTMSPDEVSRLSQGTPGQPAPPCPAADVVTSLKEQGLPVGPCVPAPEEGHQVLVPPDEPTEDASSAGEKVCVVAFLRSTVPGGPNKVEGPCGVGASIDDVELFVDGAGANCAEITYVEYRGAEPATSRVCEGDKPAANGIMLLTEVE